MISFHSVIKTLNTLLVTKMIKNYVFMHIPAKNEYV